MVEASPKIPVKDKAQLRALGFVPPSIVGSRPQCQGSAMNARFAGALDTAPGSPGVELSLDNADDVIHDTRFLYMSPIYRRTWTMFAVRAVPSHRGLRIDPIMTLRYD